MSAPSPAESLEIAIAEHDRHAQRRTFVLVFAFVVLCAAGIVGTLIHANQPWEQIHPALNAVLNGTSAVFLLVGFLAIRSDRPQLHRYAMLTAFYASSAFLASYLARFALSGTHRYPGQGWDKTLYLVVLFSHMVLAIVLVPLVLRTLWLALVNKDSERHRRLARWTWPIWMYVSLTGVAVYVMLYPLAHAWYG